MNITKEMKDKLLDSYYSNKESLSEIEEFLEDYGILDNGLSDSTETFEQGYNNALEHVFNVLGIDYEKQ